MLNSKAYDFTVLFIVQYACYNIYMIKNDVEGGFIMSEIQSIVKSVILGHTVADALGVPAEFMDRQTLSLYPVTDMEGYGTYELPKGCWSDDTSMSLAALESLSGSLDFDDIMLKLGEWYYEGKYTPMGDTFDIGNTCSIAIDNYCILRKDYTECGLTDENSNGNGSLMRIHPFVLYAYCAKMSQSECIGLVHVASALTHAHERSRIGCGIYSFVLRYLLECPDKSSVISALNEAKAYYSDCAELSHYERLFAPNFSTLNTDDIKSTGYIVDTLEAAIWCLLTTDSYEECVLRAVNLGYDTDTVAAVAGGLAGALYGYEAIPKKWLNDLKRVEYIENMCDTAGKAWESLS